LKFSVLSATSSPLNFVLSMRRMHDLDFPDQCGLGYADSIDADITAGAAVAG
jgi:hypothetical protein